MEKGYIQIEELQKIYKTRLGPVHALGPVSMNIAEGEFVSFLGPSGCGKSTLLMMIAGLLSHSEGKITINNKVVKDPQIDVGIVFQKPVLVDWRDVIGNVMLQIEMRKLDREKYLPRAKELLTSVGLADFMTNRPYELSGGMQQRTSFCRSLVHDPPMILMDEPLGALDAMTRNQLRGDLEKLWMDTKKTLLFVTHDIAEAIQLSDRIIIITPRPGKVGKIIDINLPRPRDLEVRTSKEFIEYEKEITDIFMSYGVM